MITCLWCILDCVCNSGQTVCYPQVGPVPCLCSHGPLFSCFFMLNLPFFCAVCLVRVAMWSLCLCLSLEQSLLCLHNVPLPVLKHILEASGIISGWSGRPFHGIVWLERAIGVGGRDHYPTRAEQKEGSGSWMCEAEPEGLLWLIPNITAFILIHI